MQVLEERLAMAHAVLDFDGEDLTAAEMTEGGWNSQGAVTAQEAPGFSSLFDNTRMFLDLNGDGQVNATDSQLAIDRIVALVRADYSPFNLSIAVADQDDNQAMLSDSAAGDVLVIITGGDNFITASGIGLTPDDPSSVDVDVANERDEIVWTFGGRIAGFFMDPDRFINAVATTISHEMGHAFGLDHVAIDPSNDAMSHLLMGTPTGSQDTRDWRHDFGFQDILYSTVKGLRQNSFGHLSNVLEASSSPWVGVLRPGELTVMGDNVGQTLRVDDLGNNRWEVFIGPDESTPPTILLELDASQPDIHSLNPFDATMTRINIYARGGDDTIKVGQNGTPMVVAVHAFGGDGDDRIYTSAGNDYLYGDGRDSPAKGDDILSAGDGNDHLFGGRGNDLLYAGGGGDLLFGEDGLDKLFGEGGRDQLDGGADDYEDWLDGGKDVDALYTHANHRKPNGQSYVADRIISTDVRDRVFADGSLLYPNEFRWRLRT